MHPQTMQQVVRGPMRLKVSGADRKDGAKPSEPISNSVRDNSNYNETNV